MNASARELNKLHKRSSLLDGQHTVVQAEAERPQMVEFDMDTATSAVELVGLRPADETNRNRNTSAKLIPSEETDLTVFFNRALELMEALDTVTERQTLIMNIQLWVTGGHTSTLEWYKKIGKRVQQLVSLEDLLDLTEQERAAVTEFMSKAEMEFHHRSNTAGPTRRLGWMRRVFGNSFLRP